MKLRNTRTTLVSINLPAKGVKLVIQPLGVIDVDLRPRQVIAPYMFDFGLKLEADDADYAPGAIIPPKPKTDAEEIAEVWADAKRSEPSIPKASIVTDDKPVEEEEIEGLLFVKDTEEGEQGSSEESESTEESVQSNENGNEELAEGMEETGLSTAETKTTEAPKDDGDDALGSTLVFEDVSAEDGTRDGVPQVETGDGEELEEEKAPEACPYTQTQLQQSVKSELWEICEKLGLDADGTKKELIDRIFNFYRGSR
jgi:hypothetical protein